MARKQSHEVDFPFYAFLQSFIEQERKKIYSSFTRLSRKFLNFNNPKENASAFLRPPQFEALEIYVFLKEFCHNDKMWKIFEDWYDRKGVFEGRRYAGIDTEGQASLFGVHEYDEGEEGRETDKATFKKIFEQIKSLEQTYPNYIFALTMGLGKTVLMATSIFYDFLLANKYPQSPLYCHNAIVFAPDKTVLESLREIQTFDKSKVIPAEYLNWLETNLKFYFLEESGNPLNAIENSDYNIVITNTQKIILKRSHKEKTPTQLLFGADSGKYYKTLSDKWSKMAEDAGDDIDSDDALMTNQRFTKLTRLRQLGIFVDEAHHVFGTKLSEDLQTTSKSTSLRVTINELAANLEAAGTKVVACYNFTGTPYVGKRLLPEVVYSYGLKDAIENGYLKKVDVRKYDNIRNQTLTFCRIAIDAFWKQYGSSGKRFEGMLPKMAFFASNIEELENELKPAVETVLSELNIPTSKILVNVGDSSITNNDDLREFKNLDTAKSDKQFILLVNKGKEGWNCRSLFSVALHREPKSKVFVLQATMRCLRQIGTAQETALVFLSSENATILDNELQNNFNITLDDMTSAKENSNVAKICVVPPPVSIKLKRVRKLFQLKNKSIAEHVSFNLDTVDKSKYAIIERKEDILTGETSAWERDVTGFKDKRSYSEISLIAEIARYIHCSPILIRDILKSCEDGIENILENVNEINELLYDEVIPKLFKELFEIEEFEKSDEIDVQLVKEPKDGYYSVKYKDGLLASLQDDRYAKFKDKSFNVDNYCFDSIPEMSMFWALLQDKSLEKVWFTGMLTNGQTEFLINYIDPISGGVRSYYPDFLVKKKDGSYVIIEVKGDNMIDDAVVLAKKEYAKQIAAASDMEYIIVKGTEAAGGINRASQTELNLS